MNKQKLATISCIVLLIVFTLLFGLFILFKVFYPVVSSVYEKCLYYPEDLYEEYKKEAERMIVRHEYTCQYPAKTTFEPGDNRTTLVIQIGEYDKGFSYCNYITATVKNFGTNEQEVTFERSRKSAEEALKDAEEYKTKRNRAIGVFVVILIIFTGHLIKRVIEKRYFPAFITIIIYIIVLICSVI